jgi:hypothetical protein
MEENKNVNSEENNKVNKLLDCIEKESNKDLIKYIKDMSSNEKVQLAGDLLSILNNENTSDITRSREVSTSYKGLLILASEKLKSTTDELNESIKSATDEINKSIKSVSDTLKDSAHDSNWRLPFKDSFSEIELDDDFRPWNKDQIKEILKDLNEQGVLLSGGTGTGKSYLAKNIGRYLLSEYTKAMTDKDEKAIIYEDEKQIIKSYANVRYAKFTVGKLSPNFISWGTSITGDYELGIILQAAMLAEVDPDTAYIVHLDEVTRSDFIGDLSPVFDFLSEKGKSTLKLPVFDKRKFVPTEKVKDIKETEKDTIKYAPNIYIICTANSAVASGRRYDTTPLVDSAFQDRFKKHEVIGVLKNEEENK